MLPGESNAIPPWINSLSNVCTFSFWFAADYTYGILNGMVFTFWFAADYTYGILNGMVFTLVHRESDNQETR